MNDLYLAAALVLLASLLVVTAGWWRMRCMVLRLIDENDALRIDRAQAMHHLERAVVQLEDHRAREDRETVAVWN